MAQSINLGMLRRPKNYLRGTVNAQYVRKLEGDAREVMRGDDKVLHASRWPFPTLTVRMVEETAKEGQTPTVYYEVIDGVNRLECAKLLFPKNDFDVPVVVKSYKSDAEAFADQLKLNSDPRGLYLDRDTRNKAIIMLRDEFKMSVREIAKRTGISHASVVRIKKGKQATGETGKRSKAALARKRGKSKGGKGKARRTSAKQAWSPIMLIRQIEMCSRTYDDHQPEMSEAVKKWADRSFRIGRPFATFVNGLVG